MPTVSKNRLTTVIDDLLSGKSKPTLEQVAPSAAKLKREVDITRTGKGAHIDTKYALGATTKARITAAEQHSNYVGHLEQHGVNGDKLARYLERKTQLGMEAQVALDRVELLKNNSKRSISLAREAIIERSVNDKSLKPEAVADALKHLEDLDKDLDKHAVKVEELVEVGRSKVAETTGVVARTRDALGETVAVTKKTISETGVLPKGAYEELGKFGKMGAAIKYNWKSGNAFGKARLIGCGAILFPVLAVKGLKDAAQGLGIMSTGTDEQGQPIASEGKLAVGAAELGGAALAAWAALAGGAKGARGLSH